jgi:hypothetical protein
MTEEMKDEIITAIGAFGPFIMMAVLLAMVLFIGWAVAP